MVDDNESNLLALETILQGGDRNLVRAASGDEALQYLLYNEAAVILLDVRMPGISGLETAELIRGRKKTRDVPIIFLTAYDSSDKQDLSKGYLLGAVDYIIKPLDAAALKAKVAVFVELYKKTEQVKLQAALLHEKNIQLENANFQRLGKLVDLGQQLTAERDPETLLQLFCDASRDILGARNAYVKIMESDGQSLRYLVGDAVDVETAARVGITKIDLKELNAFSSKSQPIRAPNAESSRAEKNLPIETSIRSLLSAPLSLLDQTIGWLYLVDKLDADEFSEADERLAMTLAGQLAVAYENARLYAEAQEHASELLAEVTDRKQAQEEKERLLISEKAALGWAQLMRSGKLDQEGSTRALGTIERNTKSLAQIIEDLLDVSRIITGKLRLDVSPIELEPVVAAAVDTIRPASDAKNIQLQVSLDPLVGRISGDPNRLQQVVWNLLTNAIKFTPRGGHVEVRLEPDESSARITVTDSGEGISQDFIPYIFDRFRQADSTFTRLHGGLGLGLAIVRHLVEMHGGSVSAASPGRGMGSTFAVSFPLTATRWSSNVESEGRADWRLPEQVDSNLTGLRVMIVDDELDTRELLVAMLEQRGAEVITADSTADALEKLFRESNGSFPDVLVSDIGMPGQDGIDLITRVRERGSAHGGNIPAIALTAYARDDDRSRALEAGFQRHLAKPVEPSILATTIADLAHFVQKA